MKNLAGLIVVLAMATCNAYADGSQNSTSFLGKIFGKKENFFDLNRQRRQTLTEVSALERDIRALEGQNEILSREAIRAPDELKYLAAEIPVLEVRIKQLMSEQSASPRKIVATPSPEPTAPGYPGQTVQNLTVQKAQLERRQQELVEKSARLVVLNGELKKKRDELEVKRANLAETEERIGIALNVETEKYFYRSIVSLIFAIIVFFLVYRFFAIVQSDDAVRKSIFSGDTGIQFITLFSIVIAVILFGILEILGSNELSALLGGLSGYILGKHQQKPVVT
jgi:hypothetical protein